MADYCGAENRRFALRAGFFLGRVRVDSSDRGAPPVVSHALHRRAGVRLFLQHGVHELLFVALAGWHARVHQDQSEIAGLVEIGTAAGSGERFHRVLLVHVSSAFALRGLGPRTVLFLQRRGSARALRKALFPSCRGCVLVWSHLRGSGFLCAAARGHSLEAVCGTVRIVCGDVLRDGAAPRKSAAIDLWRLDWPAGFEAYHHLGNSRPLLSWLPQATEMASRRLQRLRRRFLCVSLSGHGLVEPAGSERGKAGKRFARGNTGDRECPGPGGFTDFIYWARGGTRMHRALLQLRES